MEKEILDVRILGKQGPLQRIVRWWRGVHPDRGVIVRGWTGLETLEETIRLVPALVVVVEDERKRA
jgi:hypothetical protein